MINKCLHLGEYDQNHCVSSDTHCEPCNKRLPTCVGLPDGSHTFPQREWTSDYIKCYRNRTVSLNKCNHGYFHPRIKVCTSMVEKGEYEQNLCSKTDPNCAPCPERKPSCKGMIDGQHKFPGREWHPDFITCYKNRTVHIDNCKNGIFNPKLQRCVSQIDQVDILEFCLSNPSAVVPNPDNCAQYFNCSNKNTKYGHYIEECKYPDLYSVTLRSCQKFHTLINILLFFHTGEYKQNLCQKGDQNCEPCPSRLPSCMGQQDGSRPYPNHHWTNLYMTCIQNRTMSVNRCPDKAIFNPNRLQCENKIEQSEYQQNICKNTNRTCILCTKRLPSCVNLPDGPNPVNTKTWHPDYLLCYKNRTLDVKRCTSGYFHPVDRTCKVEVKPVDIPDYCSAHPLAIVPNYDNCAQYYNCTQVLQSGRHEPIECQYPDLFSMTTMSCSRFTNVDCKQRHEPQAPCKYIDKLKHKHTSQCKLHVSLHHFIGEYIANLCDPNDQGCIECPKRLPSCIGKSDGNHGFPGRLWRPDFITCYKNRTINITKCPSGYFNPINKKCQSKISHDTAPDFCTMNPNKIIPKENSCSQYYNCSNKNSLLGNYINECQYPDLFSRSSLQCENFHSVSCDSRLEPQAPCEYISEYVQNLCSHMNSVNCRPCKERLPSCVGLGNGNQPVTDQLWSEMFVHCLDNRTMAVRHCPQNSYFDPVLKTCVNHVTSSKNYSNKLTKYGHFQILFFNHFAENIDQFCAANPKEIVENTANCGQYYNCSKLYTKHGHFLQECKYPDLFSVTLKSCQRFTNVDCKDRPEPQAPYYIRCFRNRTVGIENCTKVDVPGYCNANPKRILPNMDNCGQFYTCSDPRNGFSRECKYPDLFSMSSLSCEKFTTIYCQSSTRTTSSICCKSVFLWSDLPSMFNINVLCIPQVSVVYQTTQYLQECNYPDLYSVVTGRCEQFNMVTCGLKHVNIFKTYVCRARCHVFLVLRDCPVV
ncbi:hypothetical protein KUTeg_006023 [Tegillarca granosa]|uniref:Chitin-binding type-2 domain-containing protein n=1 Tax=Tegillarca granosa TaxID=220873 RepID=A0ABQ9FFC8_TEGGR|nr:hypothetical protein KUTeg_006023 [Tegillarca granosa]